MFLKFVAGPYGTPRIIPRCRVSCLVRGVVTLVGLSDAPIPWPIGEKDGVQALVVYRGLARALKVKAPEAIAAAWGIPIASVKRWRADMGNGRDEPVRAPRVLRKGTPEEDKAALSETDDIKLAKRLHRTVQAVRAHRFYLRQSLQEPASGCFLIQC